MVLVRFVSGRLRHLLPDKTLNRYPTMNTAALAEWAITAWRRWKGPADDEHPTYMQRVRAAIDSTAPAGAELAERELATHMMLTVNPDTLAEWARDLKPEVDDAADAVAADQLNPLTAAIQGQREGVAMAYGAAPSTARATAAFIAKHGVPPLSPAAIQAAAALAHDERTEGFSKRPFRTNPHE